jgi:hypothetical protein
MKWPVGRVSRAMLVIALETLATSGEHEMEQ